MSKVTNPKLEIAYRILVKAAIRYLEQQKVKEKNEYITPKESQ